MKNTIIFSHYGQSNYLKYTLASAKISNPNARLIFLGDQENQLLASNSGWEHHYFEDYIGTDHDRFLKYFKHVQGAKHTHIKNGRDWLKYVFERWYHIEGFCRVNNISRFWHFDSDTMVLKDLSSADEELFNVDFTTQCNNTCLNGIVSTDVITEFCQHICSLFEDSEFIEQQQNEFDTLHPHWAFTEMRAFESYKSITKRHWIHLMSYKSGLFDDAAMQSHGFDMKFLPCGRLAKKLNYSDGEFLAYRKGNKIQVLTLNLSWLEDYVFEWVLSCQQTKSSQDIAKLVPIRSRILAPIRILRGYLTTPLLKT